MATGPATRLSDVIVPEIFTPYVQQLTETKSRLIASGAVARNSELDAKLAGGGLTFNIPSFKDLDDDAENVSTDDPAQNSTPKKTGSALETAVRLSRNQSWSSMNLTAALAGADPMESIANLVSSYWVRRMQAAFIATVKGVFADNAAAPVGTEHVQNDLTKDISDVSYTAGVTDFNASAFIDAAVTMGDSMGDLTMVAVHSIVYARMQKNNLIEFIPDARGEVTIPTFLGRIVIVDDGVPFTGGVFETWLFGAGVVQLGMSAPDDATETERKPDAGNGGGQSILYNRHQWCLHPVGHKYVGTAPDGGPSNAATANNLANADSWQRAYTERKQIKMARLITREF